MLIRASFFFIVALLASGCASSLPFVAPIPAHAIPVGINDGFHGVLPPEVFAADCPHMIRTPQTSGPALAAFMAAAPAGCPVLALVEAPDVALVDAFARLHPNAIELGNELELKPFELTPAQYGDWIDHALVQLVAARYFGTIVLGGVYALTDSTRDAIQQGITACKRLQVSCVVGVHLYDASDEDLAWLRSLKWPVWVTEVGFPIRCQLVRVQQQVDYLAAQIARFSTVTQLERVFIYQRGNGPSCSDLDTFGIAGRPAQELLR